MGEAGEGQNITHQQKKMTRRRCYAFRDRFDLELTDEQVAKTVASTSPAEDSPRDHLPARAPRGARRRPAAARGVARRAAAGPGARRFEAQLDGHRRARDLDDDGVRPHPRRARCATRRSARASSRSCPTSRARSAWRGCSASSGSSPRSASSTSREDSRPAHVLPRGQAAARSSRRASTSRARSRRWIAAGDVVRQPRRRRWCRSTSTTRCSASSGSATSPGRPATAARAGSCSAAPRGARRSTARACSTRTATATC